MAGQPLAAAPRGSPPRWQVALSNIPAPVTPLVGRQGELAEAVALLRGPALRLLTLTGPGGVGKTRLALAIAAEVDSVFDSRHFVSLAPLRAPGQLPTAIAEAMGLPDGTAADAPLDRVVARLRPARSLLVLDTFEHLIEAAPLVADLLAVCPRLAILVSSRAPLRLRGEHELPVAPLPLPAASFESIGLGEIRESPAIALFCQRARAVSPLFELSADNAGAVVAICRRLDGLPLALELAAARLKYLSPEALLSRLARRLPQLDDGPRDAPTRQQTMRAAISWSDELLGPRERRLFYATAVFVGGFTAAAAAAVCGDATEDTAGVEAGLFSLADKSLLAVRSGSDGAPRYALLDVIAEYARERLVADGNVGEMRRRHADYYVALAEQARLALDGQEQRTWFARLDEERQNLRAALAWADELSAPEPGLRLAGALGSFWYARDHVVEERARLEALLAAIGSATQAVPPAVHSAALIAAGLLALVHGDDARAQGRFGAALDLRRADGDRQGEAEALNRLGVLAYERGDLAEAEALHADALTIQRAVADTLGVAGSLAHLGLCFAQRGEDARARAAYKESWALNRAHGSAVGVARALSGLGDMARRAGDLDRAASLYEECLDLCRALGDRRRTGYALSHLAEVAVDRGDDDRAVELLQECVRLQREHGARRALAGALADLGAVLSRRGEAVLGGALLHEGLALHREVGNPMGAADALSALGLAAARQGDHALALAHLRECAALCRQVADPLRTARCLEGLAEVAAAQRQPARAARLFGTASSVREASRRPLPPSGRAAQAGTLAAVRAALGPVAFDAAWARGRTTHATEPLAAASAAARAVAPDGLTPREVEVLRLLAAGRTNPEIAAALVLSVRTVEHHINNLYGKLQVRGRAEATAYAFRHGLVGADQS